MTPDEFTKAVESALEDFRKVCVNKTPGPGFEQTLASIQAATVELLEGLKAKADPRGGVQQAELKAVREAIDQLIKDLSK